MIPDRTVDSIIHESDVIPDGIDRQGFSCGFYHAYHVNGDNVFPLLFTGAEVESARLRANENVEDILPLSGPEEPPMSNWMAFCIGCLFMFVFMSIVI